MKKLIIDLHTCSKKKHRKLLKYLFDNCWSFEVEPVTAFTFCVQDVVEYAKNEMSLTAPIKEQQAEKILELMASKADLSIGVSWDTLEHFITLYFENYADEEDDSEGQQFIDNLIEKY